MAAAIARTQCFLCKKETRTFICDGCTQNFCGNCLTKHIQTLGQELGQLGDDYDQFRGRLNEQKDDPTKHHLIQKINQWEKESIEKIEQTATECRNRFTHHTKKYLMMIEDQLNNIARELKRIREENEFNEIDLNHFKMKLNQLKGKLDQAKDISLKQHSTPFIDRIFVSTLFLRDTKWKQNGITVAGGNGEGDQLNQLNSPPGIFIGDDQTIYIADGANNRVMKWKSNATQGQVVAGGNGQGSQTNQLNRSRDVIVDRETNSLIIADGNNRRIIRWSLENNAHGEMIISNIDCSRLTMDRDGSLYVSDYVKHEVRRWKRGEKGKGTIVAGGNGQGDRLNQLNFPIGIFVDDDYSLYVADYNNHRVMKWVKDANEGLVVAGGNGKGNSLSQFSSPVKVIVDQLGQIYVSDCANDRVMRWCEGAKEGVVVVGGNGKGQQSNQFNNPTSLSFDGEGNLYVTDCQNHRIQKFEIESCEII